MIAFLEVEAVSAQLRAEYEASLYDMMLVAMEAFFEAVPQSDLMSAAIAKAIQDRDPGESAVLAVAPDTVETLKAALAKLDHPVVLVADPAVPTGEAALRTEAGEVIISMDRHLALLRRIVAARRDATSQPVDAAEAAAEGRADSE